MKFIYPLFILLAVTIRTNGQDPQFSQYYNAPLVINPAFTGGADCYRAGVNTRVQWAGLEGSFKTFAAFADLNYPDLRSGFGLMLLHDNIGISQLSSNEISGFYSYLAPFYENFNIRFGVQASYVSRSISYSKLVFEDQYSGTNLSKPGTGDPVTDFNNANYVDFSSGLILFGEDSYWLGFSAHHLNKPSQAFYKSGESRLPIKFSIHGGYNFYFQTRYRQNQEDMLRLVPSFMYKAQSKFDQLDLGLYILKNPLLLGIWYRGILPKEYENIRNNDAVILQTGFQYHNFSFTYSYDITTSSLGQRNTMGSHEVSLVYLFCLEWPPRKKPGRKVRRLPCPDFQRDRL